MLLSENTVEPIELNGTKPKSIVMSPLSSASSSFPPLDPGSLVGSVLGVKLNTGEVISPSV